MLTQLKASLPPAVVAAPAAQGPVTAGTGRGGGVSLMLVVPDETRRALRERAGREGTTIRVLVLRALKKAGYPVPDEVVADRRS